MLFWLCKRQLKLTLLGCLRTPIFALSMPSALPSCLRISSSPGEFVVRGLRS
ncbi:hypothetical protein OIU76_007288 [Salix suchowensis]|uniref:Uncharacterized protein n=1 Tax=Salix suchowensis TaxID=1278906 RepID=A0ABQ9BWB1_9ROSI|nr:hypothetical protein OIU78_012175 [Salix suchowensis]KAJ6337578.1 hypothetical protein OIU76_007288 [Salix suchowensis]KAJ6391478.1 hypothetical protein OIU77_025453 [Salix suchowensis]